MSRRVWLVLALVAAVAVASTTWIVRRSDRPALDAAKVGGIVDKKVTKAVNDLKAAPADGVSVFAAVRPELVVIQAQGGDGAGSSALGSGVIINADGHVLTALHVVKGAGAVALTFADGTKSSATIESTDPDHDIAVLTAAVLPEVVVPAVLGGGVHVGDEAFAVGHPLGLVASFSSGVISGLDRDFSLPDGRTLKGLIQFDAAVNPGNSGGPLLNRKGQVIGIVTGLANPSGDDDFVGIGFAVPINTAGRSAGAPQQ
jgi:S1-C subfamily serine protease